MPALPTVGPFPALPPLPPLPISSALPPLPPVMVDGVVRDLDGMDDGTGHASLEHTVVRGFAPPEDNARQNQDATRANALDVSLSCATAPYFLFNNAEKRVNLASVIATLS